MHFSTCSPRSPHSPDHDTRCKRLRCGWSSGTKQASGEAGHVIAKIIDSIAFAEFVDAALAVRFERQCPTFLCAPALGEAKAGEDGSDTPDLELKVLAFIVQIAIGTGSDFLGQRLPAILRQMSHVEERKENGVLGGGE